MLLCFSDFAHNQVCSSAIPTSRRLDALLMLCAWLCCMQRPLFKVASGRKVWVHCQICYVSSARQLVLFRRDWYIQPFFPGTQKVDRYMCHMLWTFFLDWSKRDVPIADVSIMRQHSTTKRCRLHESFLM